MPGNEEIIFIYQERKYYINIIITYIQVIRMILLQKSNLIIYLKNY